MGKHKMWLKRCQRESTESGAQPAEAAAQSAIGPAAALLAAPAAPYAAPSQLPFGNPALHMGMPPGGMPAHALGSASAMQVLAQPWLFLARCCCWSVQIVGLVMKRRPYM